MTNQTKALHRFAAFGVVSIAVLLRALGVFDMLFIEALTFTIQTILLTFSFFGCCWMFGKLLEMMLKNSRLN